MRASTQGQCLAAIGVNPCGNQSAVCTSGVFRFELGVGLKGLEDHTALGRCTDFSCT